ncbi:MAG: hypothetical protein AAF903_12290 [Pseudomonadota bacterium]
MSKTKKPIYWLTNRDAFFPMPDRGGRAFGKEGERIDPLEPYYATAIRQGDLTPDKPDISATAAATKVTPQKADKKKDETQ